MAWSSAGVGPDEDAGPHHDAGCEKRGYAGNLREHPVQTAIGRPVILEGEQEQQEDESADQSHEDRLVGGGRQAPLDADAEPRASGIEPQARNVHQTMFMVDVTSTAVTKIAGNDTTNARSPLVESEDTYRLPVVSSTIRIVV